MREKIKNSEIVHKLAQEVSPTFSLATAGMLTGSAFTTLGPNHKQLL